MSHLQKFPICVNIGSFVVLFARCTPGFGTFVGICRFLYQDVRPTHARFLAVNIAKLNWKGLCIYPAYTRVSLVFGFASIRLVYVVVSGMLVLYEVFFKIGTNIFKSIFISAIFKFVH